MFYLKSIGMEPFYSSSERSSVMHQSISSTSPLPEVLWFYPALPVAWPTVAVLLLLVGVVVAVGVDVGVAVDVVAAVAAVVVAVGQRHLSVKQVALVLMKSKCDILHIKMSLQTFRYIVFHTTPPINDIVYNVQYAIRYN